jgi:hypothetical protein
MTNDDQHRLLVSALLNAIPNRDAGWKAYKNDPEFHALVRVLAGLWVDLAPTLIEKSEDRRTNIELALEFGRRRLFDGKLPEDFLQDYLPRPDFPLPTESHFIDLSFGSQRAFVELHHPPGCIGDGQCPFDGCTVPTGPMPEAGRWRVDGVNADGVLVLAGRVDIPETPPTTLQTMTYPTEDEQ